MTRQDDSESKLQAAIEASFLSGFATADRDRLLAGARRVDVGAGQTLFLGSLGPQPALVVDGLIRVYMTSPGGKEVTTRYARRGGSIGVVAMVGGPPPVSLQALEPSTLLVFNPETLRSVAKGDAAAAWSLAQELTRVIFSLLDQLATNVFGTVRQRISSHLLSLASPGEDGALTVAPLTHQELANAVGTAREVASRTLRELTRAGLIDQPRDRIVILDPARLLSEVGAPSST
jgi:CRP/FNR family transcriptional regulator